MARKEGNREKRERKMKVSREDNNNRQYFSHSVTLIFKHKAQVFSSKSKIEKREE